MAEKGILVAEAETGESVACRDAVELDNDSNSRVIQRMDIGKGPLPTPFRDSANKLRSAVSSDGYDTADYFGEYGSGVDDKLLTVGDKSTLVIQLQSLQSTTGTFVVVPVLLEDDGVTIQGTLEVKEFDFSSGGSRVQIPGGEYDTFFILPFATWEVTGGNKIGIAVISSTDAYASVDIYGAVI